MKMEMPPKPWRSELKGFAMVKVSVIVPVHNSQSYLHKCVDSLLGQTLEEIEIILVDDCSTDTSPELLRQYALTHPDKIRCLYLEENIRQGGARNRGMEIARGEYIAFVDSDDFVEKDMCRALYEAAEGADLCGADYYIDDGKSLKDVLTDYGEGRELDYARRARFLGHCGYFWSRIYRRAFLKENNLNFPEKVFFEDAYFNFMTGLYARTLVKAPGQFYHYYQSTNSTVRSKGDVRQYERIVIPSLILDACKQRGIYEANRDLVDNKYISMQMGNIRHTCLGQPGKTDLSQLARIRTAVRQECPGFAKCPLYKDNLFQLRFYLRATMLSPRLAVLAYKVDWAVDLLAVLEGKLKRRK